MTVDAVIFDWGGTLTPWRTIDFDAEAAALAQACTSSGDPKAAAALLLANQKVWGRARDEQVSATLADVFAEAGLAYEEAALSAYQRFWEPATHTDSDVADVFGRLHEQGIKVGVLSNTLWPRTWHEGFFERDGVLTLVDGAVYTSEIPWTKPDPRAFRAAVEAVGVADPGRCVFVGDRLFDDVYGAQSVGMRAVHVPHSAIPPEQRGHTEGTPDAVVDRLAELPEVIARWQ